MDPLSVSAGVIAVVGATAKVIKGLRRLKGLQDAPKELDDLLAEISQFELVVQAVQKAHETPGPELRVLLDTARKILVEFDALIEYKLTEAGTSNKVDRWQWTRTSKDVERLRGKLRDVTANLVALVGVNTSTTLQEVSQITNQVLLEHRQFSNQVLPAVALLVKLLEESPPSQAALRGSVGNVRQLTLETAPQAENTVAMTTGTETLQVGQTASRTHPQSVLRISNVKKVNICDHHCACKCHILRRIGGPEIFSKLFGRGYIQTAGSFILGTRCDIESCRARTAPRVSVQYRLPQWLASRMIFLWFTSSPSCSPELLLRVPRVVGPGNAGLVAVKSGDVESLKYAIMNGECTPCDVNEYGYNLFTAAVIFLQWKTVCYLSSYGAFCDLSFLTPRDKRVVMKCLALKIHVLSRHSNLGDYPNRKYTLLTELFPFLEWESFVESEAFTTLHEIVCGLSGLSLDSELQRSTAIDALDRHNQSALCYAVRLGRLDYVRRLLEQGADPNIGDPTPIFEATALKGNYEITEVLLAHGASLSHSRTDGWLPWPIYLGDEGLAIDELLIGHGIDLNHRAYLQGRKGVTILMFLAMNYSQSSTTARMEQLIWFGADIELTDDEGRTAVMYAVIRVSHQGFNVLVRARARIDVRTVTGCTILHLAVAYTSYSFLGDVCSLCETMCDADLTTLDVDAQDEDGHTAFDLLRIRNGLNWKWYCQSKDFYMWRFRHYCTEEREELIAIRALENLLRHIQESQGVPETERYPPLGEYGSRDAEDQAVPGAWPAYQ